MSARRNCGVWAFSALLFLFTAALAAHSESAAQVVTLDYVENDPRYQTAQPCVDMGGIAVTAGNGQQVCSGIDRNGTFCIVGSDDAFPCEGFYKHVAGCNNDYRRVALNPFFCGEVCREDEHKFAKGAFCEISIEETSVTLENVRMAPNMKMLPAGIMSKIRESSFQAIRQNIMAVSHLTVLGVKKRNLNLSVGDIVIIPQSGQSDEPIFRVISNIRKSRKNVVVSNRQAALADIVTDGKIIASANLISPPPSFSSALNDASASNAPFGCNSGGIFKRDINSRFSASGSLSGCAAAGMQFTMIIENQGRRLQSAFFGVLGNADLVAKLAGELRGSLEGSLFAPPGFLMLKFSIPTTFPLVKIPIYVYVNHGTAASANLEAVFNGKYSARLTVGVKYEAGEGLEGDNSFSHNWNLGGASVVASGPQASGTIGINTDIIRFDIEPFIGPVLKKSIGKNVAIGARIAPIKTKLEVVADAGIDKCENSWWHINSGVAGEASLELQLWENFSADIPPLKLYNEERRLFEAKRQCECVAPATANPESGICECPPGSSGPPANCDGIIPVCKWAATNNPATGDCECLPPNVGAENNCRTTAQICTGVATNNPATGDCECLPPNAGTPDNCYEDPDEQPEDATGEDPLAALRGTPPPTGTETEKRLRQFGAWGGQLDVSVAVILSELIASRSHLEIAAWANDVVAARWLIANGADIHAKEEEQDWTPLHWTAWYGAPGVAKLLIDNGANVKATDQIGWTPLYGAAWENAVEVAKLLIDNGADVDVKDEDGYTPLHVAATENAADVAKLLINRGANVNAQDEDGWTPLDFAIAEERDETQSLLRRRGGRCNKAC